ncbi:MAG: adenylate/guanylate cyclase domain-containing protein, partial [Myxococcota bacterium]
QLDEVAGMFEIWCEVLDNHLGAHAEARRKQQVLSELSEALRNPILHEGVLKATEVLRRHIDLKTLALTYSPDGRPTSVNTAFVYLSEDGDIHGQAGDDDVSRYLAEHGIEVLHGEVGELRALLGEAGGFDNVLVNGLTQATVVGRLVVAVEGSELSTHDRELFERFADYLRQRLIDFNREYQRLAYAFPPEAVTRLLNEPDYERRLMPTEQSVAVLYTDIAGFTRISEQVLKEPALIGKLVDLWGDAVVRILWKHGGVFDKMVGDCVIGLWGPPFFDLSPEQNCARALRAAAEIEEFTRELHAHQALPELAVMKGELGVATGVNYCPMFVGRFGPDEDFTGFSSGMNNTARLQGVANRGEILCMDTVVDILDADNEFTFDEWRDARVKNVADPIRFKGLRF